MYNISIESFINYVNNDDIATESVANFVKGIIEIVKTLIKKLIYFVKHLIPNLIIRFKNIGKTVNVPDVAIKIIQNAGKDLADARMLGYLRTMHGSSVPTEKIKKDLEDVKLSSDRKETREILDKLEEFFQKVNEANKKGEKIFISTPKKVPVNVMITALNKLKSTSETLENIAFQYQNLVEKLEKADSDKQGIFREVLKAISEKVKVTDLEIKLLTKIASNQNSSIDKYTYSSDRTEGLRTVQRVMFGDSRRHAQ